MGAYEDVFRASTDDPEAFWLEAARGIDWETPPTRALDASRPPFYRWFPDGQAERLPQRARPARRRGPGRAGRADLRLARHETRRTYTYAALRDEVATFAGVLAGLGVGVGDRVVIYMPMVPEAAVAMLACARIGAVHSVVFGGFAPNELAVRIDDATPSVIVSASCGIEGKKVLPYKPLLDEAIELATHKPSKQVILQRPQATAEMGADDVDWADAMAAADPGRLRAGRGHRPALHPLHLRHHREAEGRGPRRRRLRRGAELVDAQRLRRRRRADDLHRVRRRLGRRPLLHRLRAAAGRAPPPCSTRASRSAPRTPGSSGGSSPSTA